jgi:pimeloyl-ACP methyl ester carboxylesterase
MSRTVIARGAATALVASAALVLAGCAESSTPLPGREKTVRSTNSNVPFNNCNAKCTGVINDAKYSIKLPEKWNGTLLLYSHGYRFAQPGPPDFAPVNTNPQVTTTDYDGSGSDPLTKALLAKGYALAGSSYKSNGWAVADGVSADDALHAKFVQLVAKPKRVYVWGDSLGGLITQLVAEKYPQWVDGAAPMCGAVAGPTNNLDLALDVAFALKTLIDPNFKITGFTSAAEAAADWNEAANALKRAAADVSGGGTAKVLTIAALVDAPNKTKTYDGHDLVSQVKATVEALLNVLAYATLGRYDIEQRVGGNASDNSKTDYSSRLSHSERQFIQSVGGKPDTYLQQLASAPRISADPAARAAFVKLGDPSGTIRVPTLTMHTEDDPLVIVQNESVLAQRAQQKGSSGDLVQLYVGPPATYSETSGAPYGAGHCVFSDRQRLALVDTLDDWVRKGVYPVPVGVASRFGAGLDPAYTPGPWPAATAG